MNTISPAVAELGWTSFFGEQVAVEELGDCTPVRVLSVHRGRVTVAGDATTFVITGDEGGRATFRFCPQCGATVWYTADGLEDYVIVPVGAFADPAFPAPTVSVYEERMHGWVQAPPGAALPGGNARAFDWSMLRGWTAPAPWLLAGGLTPDNVAEAVRVSGASAVDVSSGVERSRGVKDAGLIQAFVRNARARSSPAA